MGLSPPGTTMCSITGGFALWCAAPSCSKEVPGGREAASLPLEGDLFQKLFFSFIFLACFLQLRLLMEPHKAAVLMLLLCLSQGCSFHCPDPYWEASPCAQGFPCACCFPTISILPMWSLHHSHRPLMIIMGRKEA